MLNKTELIDKQGLGKQSHMFVLMFDFVFL